MANLATPHNDTRNTTGQLGPMMPKVDLSIETA